MTQEIYKNAELYDIFSYQQDFKKEARFIVDAVKQFKKSKGKSLLNVGCGTGSHDRYLKKHFAVTGVDLNKDILRVAKSKNPDVNYKLGNMKTFRLEKAFDVITALTGVMCYNYTYNDL